jgi:hypothetical protein
MLPGAPVLILPKTGDLPLAVKKLLLLSQPLDIMSSELPPYSIGLA